jgi:23S rRNA (adenine2030-N6)-methyltransferase
MNYRHRFHAGNFADVMKHALLVRLIQALQKKEKGFLYLDTHAGRGRYDLAEAATGDSLARQPEWPDGIGRVWEKSDVAPELAGWLTLAREFDRQGGGTDATPRYYPGSPWFARLLMRSQDRMALCEKHPAECEALQVEFSRQPRISVHEMDGYVALRAMLPPPERRALVLIDPPFEVQHEFAQITAALAEGLRRFPSGVFAVWYPLTERARVDEFAAAVRELRPPATLNAELTIAGENAPMKMKGCGLLVINPPWEFDLEARAVLAPLAELLAQAPGGEARVEWVVPEN